MQESSIDVEQVTYCLATGFQNLMLRLRVGEMTVLYLQLCLQRLCVLAGQDPHVLSFNVYLTNSFEDLYICMPREWSSVTKLPKACRQLANENVLI